MTGSQVYDTNNPVLRGAESIYGRGILIYENADDCTTQPDGSVGSPIAGCIISQVISCVAKRKSSLIAFLSLLVPTKSAPAWTWRRPILQL